MGGYNPLKLKNWELNQQCGLKEIWYSSVHKEMGIDELFCKKTSKKIEDNELLYAK